MQIFLKKSYYDASNTVSKDGGSGGTDPNSTPDDGGFAG